MEQGPLRRCGVLVLPFQTKRTACEKPCCRREPRTFKELKQDAMLHFIYRSKENKNQGVLKICPTEHRIPFKNKTKCVFSNTEIIGIPNRS